MNFIQRTYAIQNLEGPILLSHEILKYDFMRLEPSWLRESAFCTLMINLNEALQLLKRLGKPVEFTDDDLPVGKNVTDQISAMRNAVCHLKSPSRETDHNSRSSVSFCAIYGKSRGGIQIDDFVTENSHPDDLAFFYGRIRLMRRRHIEESLHLATLSLLELAEEHVVPLDYIRRCPKI